MEARRPGHSVRGLREGDRRRRSRLPQGRAVGLRSPGMVVRCRPRGLAIDTHALYASDTRGRRGSVTWGGQGCEQAP